MSGVLRSRSPELVIEGFMEVWSSHKIATVVVIIIIVFI